MIINNDEYKSALDELQLLEERLKRLQKSGSIGSKGFTKLESVRKLLVYTKSLLCMRPRQKQANLFHRKIPYPHNPLSSLPSSYP